MFFFNFSKCGFSGLLGGVKEQKMIPNDKKFCLLHLIFKISHIIWSSFMVHMCKRIISPGIFFHFFKILIFGIIIRVKRQKWPKMTEKYFCLTLYLWSCTSYDWDFWYTLVKWFYLQQSFFIFAEFWYYGFWGE